ncbi:Cell shape-determining protein Mbl [Candidatus Entotheonellaceae bacterium PAL068K]
MLAIGAEARRMIGQASDSIMAVRPSRSGVIADFECTMAMLRYFIKGHRRQHL